MNDVAAAWERFWFRRESTASLAVFRIAFGLLVLGWTLAFIPQLSDLYSPDGVLPRQPPDLPQGAWGLLGWFEGKTAVYLVFAGLLVAALCLIAGLATRLAAVAVWVGIIAFERRNPFVFNSGDGLIRILAMFLMLAPSGAALSVDSLRRGREAFWTFPERAPWVLRLVQIQISIVYLAGVWAKVRGTTWNDGTAVSYAMRIKDVARFPLPHFLTDSLILSNLMTYGTLALELSLGVLVWNRRLRPYVLLLGIGLHLSIEYQIRVGFFSMAMLVSYIAFVRPEAMERVVLAVRERLAGARVGRARRAVTAPAR